MRLLIMVIGGLIATLIWMLQADDRTQPVAHERAEDEYDDEMQRDVRDASGAPSRPMAGKVAWLPGKRHEILGVASDDPGFERARQWVKVAFDTFCAQAEVSDQRAQAVLRVLYDYQENERLYHEALARAMLHARPTEKDARIEEIRQWTHDNWRDAYERIQDMLTPDQMGIWHEAMGSRIWIELSFYPVVAAIAD